MTVASATLDWRVQHIVVLVLIGKVLSQLVKVVVIASLPVVW